MKPWCKILLIFLLVVILLLALYFFMTPRGAVSFQLLGHDPIHALTFHAERSVIEHGVDQGCVVFVLEDPFYVELTGSYLDRWTVHRYGPFCWATYGYA